MSRIKCKDLCIKTAGKPNNTEVFIDGKLIGGINQVTFEVNPEELSAIVCKTQTGSDDIEVINIEFDN